MIISYTTQSRKILAGGGHVLDKLAVRVEEHNRTHLGDYVT